MDTRDVLNDTRARLRPSGVAGPIPAEVFVSALPIDYEELGWAVVRLVDAAEAERTLPYSDEVTVKQVDLVVLLRAMGLRIDSDRGLPGQDG
jgi:hypothetical protein